MFEKTSVNKFDKNNFLAKKKKQVLKEIYSHSKSRDQREAQKLVVCQHGASVGRALDSHELDYDLLSLMIRPD